MLKISFDMKTGVSFYATSNPGYCIYDVESETFSAMEHGIKAKTPIEVNLTEEEIKAVIDENLNILMTAGECFPEQSYIGDHPDAFENIVSLGEAALPYLNKVGFERHCYIAIAAAYVINPMTYDIISTSPDGNYILQASVSTFFDMWNIAGITYDFLSIVEAKTGSIITSTKGQHIIMLNVREGNWSSDNMHAVVKEGDAKYFSGEILINISDKSFVHTLDNLYIINKMKETYGDSFSYNRYHEEFMEWISTEQVKISFTINTDNEFISGWYIYDFIKDEIVDYAYETFE